MPREDSSSVFRVRKKSGGGVDRSVADVRYVMPALRAVAVRVWRAGLRLVTAAGGAAAMVLIVTSIHVFP